MWMCLVKCACTCISLCEVCPSLVTASDMYCISTCTQDSRLSPLHPQIPLFFVSLRRWINISLAMGTRKPSWFLALRTFPESKPVEVTWANTRTEQIDCDESTVRATTEQYDAWTRTRNTFEINQWNIYIKQLCRNVKSCYVHVVGLKSVKKYCVLINRSSVMPWWSCRRSTRAGTCSTTASRARMTSRRVGRAEVTTRNCWWLKKSRGRNKKKKERSRRRMSVFRPSPWGKESITCIPYVYLMHPLSFSWFINIQEQILFYSIGYFLTRWPHPRHPGSAILLEVLLTLFVVCVVTSLKFHPPSDIIKLTSEEPRVVSLMTSGVVWCVFL